MTAVDASPLPQDAWQLLAAELSQRAFGAVRAALQEVGVGLGVMLYGSQSRGTADPCSDIDVLQLVSRGPRSCTVAGVNLAQYLPAHLTRMASSGSLFVLHLTREGKVVVDPYGLLDRCISSYEPPTSYDIIKSDLALAAAATDPRASDCQRYLPQLVKLGIYLLRTATYIACIEQRGEPVFDSMAVTRILGDTELRRVFELRRKTPEDLRMEDLVELHGLLRRYLPRVSASFCGSVESLAVTTAHVPQVSALLAMVLAGAADIDYTSIALPPM